jgi:hypothetical protein
LADWCGETPFLVVELVALLSAGTVSWLIVRPGKSLLLPIAADVLIFVIVGVSRHWIRPMQGRRLNSRGSSWSIAAICIVSVFWTYFGVLAASVVFDSAAASAARHEVAISASGCQPVEHGSVGFINAPYVICTHEFSGASIVEFTKAPYVDGGYYYVTGQSKGSWDPDGCARHLFGNWWAYAIAVNSGCPLGYGMQGGG